MSSSPACRNWHGIGVLLPNASVQRVRGGIYGFAGASPARARIRTRISSDSHMPCSLKRLIQGSTLSVKPRDLASSSTFSVPQTERPAAWAIRRASISSRSTTCVLFSRANAMAASSPGPKSNESHSEGVAAGSTTSSQRYLRGSGQSEPSALTFPKLFSNRPRPEGVALGRPARAGQAHREAPLGGVAKKEGPAGATPRTVYFRSSSP